MTKSQDFALKLHEHVPPNWYFESIKVDPFQKFWHKTRHDKVREVIEQVNGQVLDIGANDGVFSKIIYDKTKAKKLIGIDVLKSTAVWANRHWKGRANMVFKVMDAHKLKFKANMFDAVFILEALEHVMDPKEVLIETKRVLQKGGYGVFLVPTDNFLFRTIWYFWLHFYPRGWVWRDTHIQSFKSSELSKICKKIGFKVEKDIKFNLGMLHLVKVRKI